MRRQQTLVPRHHSLRKNRHSPVLAQILEGLLQGRPVALATMDRDLASQPAEQTNDGNAKNLNLRQKPEAAREGQTDQNGIVPDQVIRNNQDWPAAGNILTPKDAIASEKMCA